MGVPGVAVQPVGEDNSESAVRFLIDWVSDSEAEAPRCLADHAEPAGASLVAAHGHDAIGYVAIVWKSTPTGCGAGLTRFTTVEGPTPWTPSQRETIHVLEGEVTIEIAGGPALTLKPGDLASLPAGQISHFGAVQVRPGVSAFWWRSCLAVPGTRLAAGWGA